MAPGALSYCSELQYSDAMRRLTNKSYKATERALGLLPKNKDSPFGDFPVYSRPQKDSWPSAGGSITPITRFNQRETAARSKLQGPLPL
ncbi:flagellar basal body pacrg family protein [Cyclospora cayetanensis]|uniref:Flagellar basal body pacrg family protein n=1 Tax=Cyclospora cayetanensis TaxID=88456 RepID=A0A1D3CUE5_9EIME|nr:flagellar basal body pacrg family protein [Cyclospora cayetanensis]OEH74815.1 flagellar basal body pacrg family protein [Cyclospora cayetanensis]